jgi:HEPN domain-containing protein
MPDEADLVRGWLLKGDSDPSTTRTLLAADGPHDTACFHAQQAAEKYLKALLAFTGAAIPRTHNLEDIHESCRNALPGWDVAGVDVSELTSFAVELRYDFEFWPERETAQQALEQTERIREAVVSALPRDARLW